MSAYFLACYPNGFKIRSMKDLATALNKYITKGVEHFIIIDPHTALSIEIMPAGGVKVRMKYGDLYDLFNPQIQIPAENALSHLWKYRKHINAKFFYD